MTTTVTKLLTSPEAAALLGIKNNTLEIYRVKGTGPKFIKLNPASKRSPIRYRQEDLDAFLAGCTCDSTSQYPNP